MVRRLKLQSNQNSQSVPSLVDKFYFESEFPNQLYTHIFINVCVAPKPSETLVSDDAFVASAIHYPDYDMDT